ncbi:MAG: metallophosphoesterase [Verrucomicrobiae bacterium]|nr:metallophosphoesterase [Verrucomicrobiae bacterium]
MKDQRLIAIGDIHGCIRELEKLLKKIKPGKKDRIIFLGDLINRGPDSKAVIELARDLKATSLLGNHEYRLLKFYHDLDSKDLRPYEKSTLASLDANDWNYLASMVLWLEIPRELVFVHGGFLPHIPWRRQSASIVTQIQMVDNQGLPRKRGEVSGSRYWADLWKQRPFVIYGHTPRSKVYKRRFSLGIDTGCVWGGKLTAYILPDNKIIQVNAAKNYIR